MARLADLAVWREREAFEEKQNRALALLRKKDAKIKELGEAVARRRSTGRQRAAADGRVAAAAGPGRAAADGGGGGGGGGRGGENGENAAAVVERLEECVEEQADQIEALLQEVRRRLEGSGTCRCYNSSSSPLWRAVRSSLVALGASSR